MANKTFVYRLTFDPAQGSETGEMLAANEADARRQLRVKYVCTHLPGDTLLIEKPVEDVTGHAHESVSVKSAKARQLLHIMADHHLWLKNGKGGKRANLTRLNLAGLKMPNAALPHADIAEADLSFADLAKANLQNVNLVRANLQGANLQGADLTGADLSDADLRDAVLTGAKLKGADFWRANLIGCKISPKALHMALSCKTT
jgi:hypothetical protein